MKPIKWRVRDGIRSATVEGVEIRRYNLALSVLLHADFPSDAERKFIELGMPKIGKQQTDAAAYALADLVATLRGFE